MRRPCTQLAMTGCFLLAVSSALGQTQPSTTTIPRSRYSPMAAAQAQGQVQRQPDTWYEFLLKRFNPNNVDYGASLEQRRRAFLEASVNNPYFWYSFWITVWSLFVMLAFAKLWIDCSRKDCITAEMTTDLYNQDQYSREAAKEAIAKYNQHIEQCNRVIEAAESGRPIPASGSEAVEPAANLQQLTDQLTAMTGERDTLRRELREKASVVTDMSLRIEALSGKTNDNGDRVPLPHVQSSSDTEPSDSTRLMGHINYLQQQLYAERQKNKRLKGA